MLASGVPVKFNIPFANNAGAGFIRPIPEASQIGIEAGAASLTDGFVPVNFDPVGAGGTPPFGQDFNGLMNQETKWSQWVSAGGPIAYDGTFQAAIGGYPKGAQVASATTFGVWWLSTADSNTTDPDASGAGWVRVSPLNLYGLDTGAANAYVVAFSPVLVANVVGLPLRFKVLNANTGASTLNAGPGAAAIVRRDGSALIGGELPTSGIVTVTWDGTAYQLQGIAPATAAAAAAMTDTQSAVTPAMFLGVLSDPGYQKLPSGLIIQWGSGSYSTGTIVALPVTFPVAGLNAQGTAKGTSANGITIVQFTDTSHIQISFTGAATQTTFWQALGH